MVVDVIFGSIIEILTTPELFLWLFFGFLIGVILGAIPGIGPVVAIAIFIPISTRFDATVAFIFMVALYYGASYGGSISAILINVPGTGSAAATTFDGYGMSKDGRAIEALNTSATASGLGGIVSALGLLVFITILVPIVLLFRTQDFFLIALLGIVLIGKVSTGSLVKGVVAGMFGFLISTIGIAPIVPDVRYTFGAPALYGGVQIVSIILGIFAITEMLSLSIDKSRIAGEDTEMLGDPYSGIQNILKNKLLTFQSIVIGTIAGLVPGSGGLLGSFMSYTYAIQSEDGGEEIGSGDPRGVIAAEAANNSAVAGTLVPTLAFGIPGSTVAAVLLGGLILHGLNPGPLLFGEQLPFTVSLFVTVLICGFLLLILGNTVFNRMGYITRIDVDIIIPVVIIAATIGVYSLRMNSVDLISMLSIGLIGYFMRQYNFSIIAFIMGLILGPLAENNFMRALTISDGSYWIFVSHPTSVVLVVLIVALLFDAPLRLVWRHLTASIFAGRRKS